MKAKFTLLFIAVLSASTAFCQTYIKNVTVVDVVKARPIADQTVTIKGDIISDIAPSKKVSIPANATVIDGAGKFFCLRRVSRRGPCAVCPIEGNCLFLTHDDPHPA